MKNRYEIRGDITVIFLDSPKYGQKEATIDTVDLQKVSEFPNKWGAHWDPTTLGFYCRGKVTQSNRKRITVYLHRWVSDCPENLEVDHFDNDTLNNRRDNLRILTHSENQQNPKGAQQNSTSGVLGVHRNAKGSPWKSAIEVDGKKIYLGSFTSIAEANEAVRKRRAELMPFSKEAVRVRETKKDGMRLGPNTAQ